MHAWRSNEVAYRRYKEREAVIAADDGMMAPLSLRPETTAAAALSPSGLYGCTYGTEAVQSAGAPLRRWKAAAVMRMLERKVSKIRGRST